MARPRVVIVGAGFGGLCCARRLEGGPCDVLLIDRNNYHLFTPLLYQVASSLLNPSDIAFPVRKVFRGSSNVQFRQAEVEQIDFAAKTVRLATGEALAYDRVVIAAGTVTHYFGNAAIERRALGLKTLGEALQLRNHILSCLEQAAVEADAARQQALMTFVIVGGGPTGVEYAGALAELMRLVLAKEYPTIAAHARIVLVEGQKQLLAAYSQRLGDYARGRLEKLGVEVRLGALVEGADDARVILSDGAHLGCETLVWSAGVRPNAIAERLRVALTPRSKRILVDEFARIAGHPEAFAIGDLAGAEQDGKELPQISPPAMQMGRYVGDFILAHLRSAEGSPEGAPAMAPFRYWDKGTMATIGRNAAVVQLGGLALTGLCAWVVWLLVHIYYLIGYRNRLVVLWGWAWNYLWYDRPVRIIAEANRRARINQ